MKRSRTHLWLLGSVLIGVTIWLILKQPAQPSISTPSSGERQNINRHDRDAILAIHHREQEIAETLWRDEYMGQYLSRTVERWWDQINASDSKLTAIQELNLPQIILGNWEVSDQIDQHNIQRWKSTDSSTTLNKTEWYDAIEHWKITGWELNTIEFRHVKFDPTTEPYKSEFYFRAALSNPVKEQRRLIEGPLVLSWKLETTNDTTQSRVLSIDTRQLEWTSSQGPPPFERVYDQTIPPPTNADAIDPLLVHDLNGDGQAEIVLANKNLVFRFNEDGQVESTPLCTFPPGLLSTAVFTDLNNDGAVDFLCHKHEGLVVLPGSNSGEFDQYEIMLRPSSEDTLYPMVLSTGDIDRDGDQDIFIGQYRIPYEGGSLPTPFWDANDGSPFFLLRNDGNMQFKDITTSALPNAKRNRRIYSASLVDMDHKNGPDLVVVSDFAGLDVYLNDGNGGFTAASTSTFGDTLCFGMAHAIADFNTDGMHDLLMIGMTSPTVDRLEYLGLHRPGLTNDTSTRSRLAYGNRLFISTPKGHFEQNALSASVARTGWSWGCSAADFDNDGYPDVYIGNGLESGQSVQDYESEYWLHDAFIANSEKSSLAYLYFKEKFAETRGKDQSYGGYESNRLFLNQSGEYFLDVGHHWGVGIQHDTRNVVTDDLNGDGRMDLVFLNYQIWPEVKESLRIYLNQMPDTGNWIEFHPQTGSGIPSPIGLKITIHAGNQKWTKELVNGDSYRSQHSQIIHFGLGEVSVVDAVEIQWPDGRKIQLSHLETNQHHQIPYSNIRNLNDKE